MKLHELKAPAAGAFATNIKKLSANMSLSDLKDALRRSSGLDDKLVKKVCFASSFRRHNDKVVGGVLSTTLEIPNLGMVDVEFKLKHGVVVVSKLAMGAKPEEEADAAK